MDEHQTIGLVSGIGALVLVLSSLTARRLSGGQIIRYGIGWMGIFALGYTIFLFRDELAAVWQRAQADVTGTPIALSNGEAISIRMDDDGHFWVTGRTDSARARMLIDSGATTTILTRSAAQRLGVLVEDGFPVIVGTANGNVRMQRGRVSRLLVGDIVVNDLPVLVSDAGDINVLGMNWLGRMQSWRVAGREMVIEPRSGPQ
jgi:aspartyl protease family protein